MTTEHLRPLLDEWSSVQVLFKAGEVFGRAEIPDTVIQMVKMGRLTALSKLDGGVRGAVTAFAKPDLAILIWAHLVKPHLAKTTFGQT